MPPRPYARPAAESSSAASERRGGSRPAGEIKSGKLDPLPVRLKRLGLVSDWDFVLHLPLRYEDETRIDPIGLLRAGETAQIQGEVVRSSTISTARGPQLVAELADQTGRVTLRFIHYYPTTRSLLTIGTTLRAFGEPRPADLNSFIPNSRSPWPVKMRFLRHSRRFIRSAKGYSKPG